MNCLKINQSGTETIGKNTNNVGARIIDKLYEKAKEGIDSNQEVDLTGSIITNKAYRNQVDWLEQNTDLNINVTGSYYIKFQDSEVSRILNDQYGDGFGITETAASSISSIGNIFKNNTTIEYFDEFKYFTNITKITNLSSAYYSSDGDFFGCTNLKSIDLTNIIGIEGKFDNCKELVTVKNFNGTYISKYKGESYSFDRCSKLQSINLSNCIVLGSRAFCDCTSLNNIGDLKKLKYITTLTFDNCQNLAIDINCPLLGDFVVGDQSLMNINTSDQQDFVNQGPMAPFSNSGIVSISNLGKLQKMKDGTDYYQYVTQKWYKGFASNCHSLRFAILPDTLTYIGTYAFHEDDALEYVKVLVTVPPTLGSTDITARAFPFFGTTCNFYVPDAVVNDYKAASGWSAVANRIFPMSQFSTDFPNN